MRKYLFIPVLLLSLFILFSCSTTGRNTKAEKDGALIELSEEKTAPAVEKEDKSQVMMENKEESSDQEEKEASITGTKEEISLQDNLTFVEEDEEPVDEVITAFNYAYGVKNMRELIDSGVSIIARYFQRGLYDGFYYPGCPLLMNNEEMEDAINDYITEYLTEGITFEPGEMAEDISSLFSLSSPSDIPEAFSYAYGFSIVNELLGEEIDIVIEPFMRGMMDELYKKAELGEKEITDAVNSYILLLNENYYASLEKTKAENLENAEEFLVRNSKADGVTTLENGVQIIILDADEELGNKPTQYDTVIMDYNEYILDFETGELVFTDAAYNVEVSLITLDNGLQSAVSSMRTGEAVRAYIPPELSRLPQGDEDIPPYSLFVYDVALHKIL